MVNTRIRKINERRGKTYQDTRLNADGALTRPVRIARSSKGAPMMAIPSRAIKQERRTNAIAPATTDALGLAIVMLYSI
jgi:hypothetical protein